MLSQEDGACTQGGRMEATPAAEKISESTETPVRSFLDSWVARAQTLAPNWNFLPDWTPSKSAAVQSAAVDDYDLWTFSR